MKEPRTTLEEDRACGAVPLGGRREEGGEMWEYMAANAKDLGEVMDIATNYAAGGWELVSVLPNRTVARGAVTQVTEYVLFLKREPLEAGS